MITSNYSALMKNGVKVGEVRPGEVKQEDLIEGSTVASYIRIVDGDKVMEFMAGDIIPIKEVAKPKKRRKTSVEGA